LASFNCNGIKRPSLSFWPPRLIQVNQLCTIEPQFQALLKSWSFIMFLSFLCRITFFFHASFRLSSLSLFPHLFPMPRHLFFCYSTFVIHQQCIRPVCSKYFQLPIRLKSVFFFLFFSSLCLACFVYISNVMTSLCSQIRCGYMYF